MRPLARSRRRRCHTTPCTIREHTIQLHTPIDRTGASLVGADVDGPGRTNFCALTERASVAARQIFIAIFIAIIGGTSQAAIG